jgi:hypothetical protein
MRQTCGFSHRAGLGQSPSLGLLFSLHGSLASFAKAADFQLVVHGFKAAGAAYTCNFGFNGLVISEYQNFSAAVAGHMVVMVLKYIAELQFRMPAQLQPADNAKVFKNFYVPIYSCLVVAIQQGNQFVNS